MFVKPANLGSSVGISKVKSQVDLVPAIELALEFDRKVVVEAAVPNAREIECAVLGNDEPEASLPGEIIPSREFYDYEAKYLDDDSKSVIPADLPADTVATVKRLSIEAFRAIDAAGLARVDFLLARDTGEIVLNEINTMPGFTSISMYSKMWDASGVELRRARPPAHSTRARAAQPQAEAEDERALKRAASGLHACAVVPVLRLDAQRSATRHHRGPDGGPRLRSDPRR